MKPKFSIVIPIYKVEKYLCQCIDSVLCQTFKDYEMILIDDGSPDACPQICDKYVKRDSRISVIHQQNAGLACARNMGIKVASGEYLICIDSDDYLANEYVLQHIADKTQNGTDVILYGFRKLFESNDSFAKADIPNLNKVSNTQEMLCSVLSNNSYCGTAWTKAVKLQLLHEHEIEFRPKMISEDIDWYLHVMCYAKTYDSVNEVVIIYRQRPDSISHAPKLNSFTDNLWILETWPMRIKNLVHDQKTVDALMQVLAYYYANNMILYSWYPSPMSAPYKQRFQAQKFLLDYAITPRALIISKVYRFLGFNITTKLLRIYANVLKRV